jgi:phospholipid/cholesterol/gamma-HCH transport system ATP-binding protein
MAIDTKNPTAQVHIRASDLTLAYGDFIVQKDLNFSIMRGDIFIIMGGSGCGKSTLLRHLIGLHQPARGQIRYDNVDFWAATESQRKQILLSMGVLFQSGAVFSSMTLADNVSLALSLSQSISLSNKEMRELASFKLSLVGLKGFEDYYPYEISGGMRKRAGIARAIALDPRILFFDEPSAGLDPISAKLLDDLIVELRDTLGTSIVVVTHELPSIFAIANNSIFLDEDTKTIIACGHPADLLHHSDNEKVQRFLTRGGNEQPDHGKAKPSLYPAKLVSVESNHSAMNSSTTNHSKSS